MQSGDQICACASVLTKQQKILKRGTLLCIEKELGVRRMKKEKEVEVPYQTNTRTQRSMVARDVAAICFVIIRSLLSGFFFSTQALYHFSNLSLNMYDLIFLVTDTFFRIIFLILKMKEHYISTSLSFAQILVFSCFASLPRSSSCIVASNRVMMHCRF